MRKYFNINYEFDISMVHASIDRRITEDGAAYICVADGNILSMVHRDLEYRNVISGSMFSICDSSWVPLYLNKLYGFKPLQYCGSQIFRDLIEKKCYRMMFLGGSADVLEALRMKLSGIDSRIVEMPFVELPFLKAEDFDYQGIAEKVNSYSPDIVWVALGAPKQEIFASRLTPLLKRGLIIPVGAVFNFFSGTGIRRAPQWMVKMHLEFFFRIFTEPKKQFRRCRMIICTLPGIYKEEKRKK